MRSRPVSYYAPDVKFCHACLRPALRDFADKAVLGANPRSVGLRCGIQDSICSALCWPNPRKIRSVRWWQPNPGTVDDIRKRSDIDGHTGFQDCPVGACQGVLDVILGNFVAVGGDRPTGIALRCQIGDKALRINRIVIKIGNKAARARIFALR